MKAGDRFTFTGHGPDYLKNTVFIVLEVKPIKCKSIPDYNRLIGKGYNGCMIDTPERFAEQTTAPDTHPWNDVDWEQITKNGQKRLITLTHPQIVTHSKGEA